MARKIEKMRKNILSFIALVVIIFSACAQQKKTTASKATNTKKAVESSIQQIVMDRTACFGTCPTYRLEVNKDGKVIFKSWAFTEYEGTYEKKFAPEKVAALFKQFDDYKVDTCAEEYTSLIADVPGIMYYIQYPKKEKKIMNAHFGPEFLNMLAKETDDNFKVDDTWTKTAEAEKH